MAFTWWWILARNSRFLSYLGKQDPLMEFSARPLPPDDGYMGTSEQARCVAAPTPHKRNRSARPVSCSPITPNKTHQKKT